MGTISGVGMVQGKQLHQLFTLQAITVGNLCYHARQFLNIQREQSVMGYPAIS
jgi:hypothetical protein